MNLEIVYLFGPDCVDLSLRRFTTTIETETNRKSEIAQIMSPSLIGLTGFIVTLRC